jgi:EAL domain-containing protein (putative c-di-GMP-specific phosphodiesterase class I)
MIASRLLKLAKDLGVTVVAEGVETEEQWLWLVAHAADFVQGFFGRSASPPPVPTALYA